MLLGGVERILAIQADASEKAPQPVQVKAVDGIEARVEVGGKGVLVAGDEPQQRPVPVHLDNRPVRPQQGQGGGRFEFHDGLLDRLVGVFGVGFDFHSSDLFDLHGLPPQRYPSVLDGLDHRTIRHPCRQHQRGVTGTGSNDGDDLGRGWRGCQQCLKAVGHPCPPTLQQAQSLLLIHHIGREHEAVAFGRGWQDVDGFGLEGQGLGVGLLFDEVGVVGFGVEGLSDHPCHHDLVVLPQVLARECPDIDARGVLGEEDHRFFGQVGVVDRPQHQAPCLNPLPAVAQEAKLDALVAPCLGIVVVGWVEPPHRERPTGRAQAFDISLHRLTRSEASEALGGASLIQFVGIRGHPPRLGGDFQKLAFPGERVEQFVGGGGRCHQRGQCLMMLLVDGEVAHDDFVFHTRHDFQ